MKYRAKRDEVGRRISEHAVAGTMDVLTNIKTVRCFATEAHEISKYERSNGMQSMINQRTNVVSQACLAFFIALLIAGVGFVTYVCASDVAAGRMHAADVPNYVIKVGIHLRFCFQDLIELFPKVMQMLMPLNRVVDHLSSTSFIEPNPNSPAMVVPIKPDRFKGRIEFRDVHFYYPLDLRKKVLNGLTFTIEPGQKVGICGEAGCGKSTTYLLLQRLFDPDASAGCILIDGIDMRRYDVHCLRRRICMVAQACSHPLGLLPPPMPAPIP